jgi:hypothetical protein
MTDLPVDSEGSDKSEDNGRQNGGRFVAIKDFHYHGNDITELRKLAEINPALADKVIDQRDRSEARFTSSYNFGVGASIALLAILLITSTIILLFGGILQLLAAVMIIFSAALLIRVVLTGEWSDTSWFGKFVGLLVKALGGKPSSDEDD